MLINSWFSVCLFTLAILLNQQKICLPTNRQHCAAHCCRFVGPTCFAVNQSVRHYTVMEIDRTWQKTCWDSVKKDMKNPGLTRVHLEKHGEVCGVVCNMDVTCVFGCSLRHWSCDEDIWIWTIKVLFFWMEHVRLFESCSCWFFCGRYIYNTFSSDWKY